MASTVGLLVLNALVARLGHFVEGSPALLALHGEAIVDHVRREGLDQETLKAALHEHSVAGLRGVEMAPVEIDGSSSVGTVVMTKNGQVG